MEVHGPSSSPIQPIGPIGPTPTAKDVIEAGIVATTWLNVATQFANVYLYYSVSPKANNWSDQPFPESVEKIFNQAQGAAQYLKDRGFDAKPLDKTIDDLRNMEQKAKSFWDQRLWLAPYPLNVTSADIFENTKTFYNACLEGTDSSNEAKDILDNLKQIGLFK